MVEYVDKETPEAAIGVVRGCLLPAPMPSPESALSHTASGTQALLNRAADRLVEQYGCTRDDAVQRIYEEARNRRTLLSTAAWTVLARVGAAEYGCE